MCPVSRLGRWCEVVWSVCCWVLRSTCGLWTLDTRVSGTTHSRDTSTDHFYNSWACMILEWVVEQGGNALAQGMQIKNGLLFFVTIYDNNFNNSPPGFWKEGRGTIRVLTDHQISARGDGYMLLPDFICANDISVIQIAVGTWLYQTSVPVAPSTNFQLLTVSSEVLACKHQLVSCARVTHLLQSLDSGSWRMLRV